MHRPAQILIACAVVALSAGLSPAAAQELKNINVMSPNDTSCSPYPQIVADEFGFFAAEGLKITLLPSSTDIPFVAFLANGDADVVVLDSGQVFQAVDKKQPIAVIYEAYQWASDGIAVPEDSPIKGLADLKGTTIGLASDRDQLTTIIALNTVGIDISEVETVVVGESGPVLANALKTGQVQAYAAGNSEHAAVIAAGLPLRNITPPEVSQVPGNSWTVWKPTIEEKRPMLEGFLRAWAKGQHAGVLDIKAVMSACKKRIPEQWETPGNGERVVNNSVYNTQLRRTKNFGELQADVWEKTQAPHIKLEEIGGPIDTATFLDSSFIEAANAFTTDDVKQAIAAWKDANKDILIP